MQWSDLFSFAAVWSKNTSLFILNVQMQLGCVSFVTVLTSVTCKQESLQCAKTDDVTKSSTSFWPHFICKSVTERENTCNYAFKLDELLQISCFYLDSQHKKTNTGLGWIKDCLSSGFERDCFSLPWPWILSHSPDWHFIRVKFSQQLHQQ